MNPTLFDQDVMAPPNEAADARELREAFAEQLGPLNPVQAFYMNYLVRGAITTIRAEVMETVELTRAFHSIRKKLQDAGESMEDARIQALAMRAVSRDIGRLEDLLKSQNWGSRECHKSIRDVASSAARFRPPSVPSCRQDLVEDPALRSDAPPLLKAA